MPPNPISLNTDIGKLPEALRKIQEAAMFAGEKHAKQLDDAGKPYIEHLQQVAGLVSQVTGDPDIICAAYLHDTIEDTETTYEELEKAFGKRIADLAYEVTHEGKKDEKGYYFPRLHSRDAILIKFADRLSNLSRMDVWSKSRQEQYLKKSTFWKNSTSGWDEDAWEYQCSDGKHPSFWKTVVQSPQWKAWYDEQTKRFSIQSKEKQTIGCYDMDECQECGWMGDHHFQDFLAFTTQQAYKEKLDALRVRIMNSFTSKSILGLIQSAFNDHKGSPRRLIMPSIAKRVWGGIRGLLITIIDEERESAMKGGE